MMCKRVEVTWRRVVGRQISLLIALFAVVAFTACGCGSERVDRLDVLKSDPMATIELEGRAPIRVSESAGGENIGIPSPSRLRREFSSSRLDDDAASLAKRAGEAGWTVAEQPAGGYRGSREIDELSATISIIIDERDQIVSVELMIGGGVLHQ